MKKILSTLAAIALVSLSFTSCKKEKAKTTSEEIIGVWHLSEDVYHSHSDGYDHIETISGGQNDTYEFKSDGTVNVNIGSATRSYTYSIIGDNKISLTDDETYTYDIKKLDDQNLVLYIKETVGDEFGESTITFNR